jgi:beta-galactosidase
MRKTGEIVRANDALLSGFRPDPPSVGVWFSPQSYYLHWAEERHGYTPQAGVLGVARALTRRNLPYRIVEEEHRDALEGLRLLFLPRTLVVDDEAAQAPSEFVRKGGALVTESECGAFVSNGIYREPEERFLAALTGVREIGRRNLSGHSLAVRIAGKTLQAPAKQWLTPFEKGKGRGWARSEDGPTALDVAVGKGGAVMFGTYLGDAYFEGSSKRKKEYAALAGNFETVVENLARRAGVAPTATVAGGPKPRGTTVLVRCGRSGTRRVFSVFSTEPGRGVNLRFAEGDLPAGTRDILTGKPIAIRRLAAGTTCALPASEWGIWVLAGP